jgi:hypothetical protein
MPAASMRSSAISGCLRGDGPVFHDWLQAEHSPLAGHLGFVTGDTLVPLAGRFLAPAGCPILEKPFTLEDVLASLANLTEPA